MPWGTYFFTYGLPAASSRCLAKVRKRPLASVRCSVPLGASAIRATDAAGESSASRLKHCRTTRRKAKPTPMALGCCVGCATKKVSKKVAGNAIPRSRLLSDREIAYSRGRRFCLMNKQTKDGDIKKQLPERFVPAAAVSVLRNGSSGRKSCRFCRFFLSVPLVPCGRVEPPDPFAVRFRRPEAAARRLRYAAATGGFTIGCRDRGFCLRCL
ncbi:Uncharacterised protein [Rikenella microfusus]|uniref:Uncharacterized protein n=1 Tax=Rikenella microfusus TaxID=28139 RepID=A0A379MSG1_9BACT|nr:Uncharacterised protein [Rikenella microfusus]